MFFEQDPISACPSLAPSNHAHSFLHLPLPLSQKTPSNETQTYFQQNDIMRKSEAGVQQGSESVGARVGQRLKPKEMRRRLEALEEQVMQLQRENEYLRRNQHQCQRCCHRQPEFYINEATETHMEEEIADGSYSPRNRSADSIEFEQVDLNSPLMNSSEMEEKMWIFLGLTLIAMGSKVSKWDGAISSFKVLREAVDELRRQVQRSEKKVSMNVFCTKEDLKSNNFIDGVDYDPFYAEEYTQGLLLDHVRIETVDPHGLYYDSKYKYSINYEALLTIMQYARDYCVVS